jgi:hypothetical protein
MNAIGFKDGWHVQCHVLSLPNASLAGGLPGMAVRAQDLAFCNLDENRRPRETGGAHVGDIVALVAEMVELKDDRVSLAALNARMLGQVLPHA